jgi:hypothetical protein
MREKVVVGLVEPVQAHGETVRELVLRPLTGRELRQCGYPFKIEGGRQIVDTEAVARLASELAGVPTSTIDQLAAEDWNALVPAVLGFLGAQGPRSSIGISSVAPSGAISPT